WCLAKTVPNQRMAKQLPDLILNGANPFASVALVRGKFMLPKREWGRIRHLAHDLGAVRLINQKTLDTHKRGMLCCRERGQAHIQAILHPGSPGVTKKIFES